MIFSSTFARSILNKRIFLKLLSLILVIFSVLSFSSCTSEERHAKFGAETKMYANEGIAIIMDSNFTKYYPENCSLAAENGDFKFEAFYIEKSYFTEDGRNITTPEGALEYVNPGKDEGATVELNFLWQPYVEFLTPDPNGTKNDIHMYYTCIEYGDKYWFCSFFSYDKNFEEYSEYIYTYLYTLKCYEVEK